MTMIILHTLMLLLCFYVVFCQVRTRNEIVSAPPTDFKCGERGQITIRFSAFELPTVRKKRSSFRSANLGKSIVGGTISHINSWPWMVLLGRKREPLNNFFCSGALLNHDFVLTAAHCVLELEPFFARFGEHDYSNPASGIRIEDIIVKEVLFHPKYDISKGYNDLALLKLVNPINFRNEVNPVCLPWGAVANEDLVNKKVTVTGWGTEEFGGQASSILREVEVEVFDPAVCQKNYSELPNFFKDFPEGMNKGNIVCAGDAAGMKDSCQGDSGGPMVHQTENGIYILAGIISKGYGCGLKEFPGLYAPLRNYETLQWIKTTAF